MDFSHYLLIGHQLLIQNIFLNLIGRVLLTPEKDFYTVFKSLKFLDYNAIWYIAGKFDTAFYFLGFRCSVSKG